LGARSWVRTFGPKEQLVIWEPHDVTPGPLVLADDVGDSPLHAVGALVLFSLVAGMTEDLDLVRRRMRLVFTLGVGVVRAQGQPNGQQPGHAEHDDEVPEGAADWFGETAVRAWQLVTGHTRG
jgi:hypothetical protein